MILTNIYNLPNPIVSAIKNDKYKKVGDISVTGLLRPTQISYLEKLHADEITEDASDGVWRLLGQSVHAILERADTSHHLSEERLTANINGWVVSGQPDLLDKDGVLSDYKVTSVFSFSFGEKPEWVAQLNIYAWLYRRYGFDVKKLQIVAILRDWTSSKIGEGYPEAAVKVVEIPMWTDSEVSDFLSKRVSLHQDAIKGNYIQCTPEERWERPTTYAVIRDGVKRAKRVFDSKDDAIAYLPEAGKGYIVVERPGQQVRCSRFCTVSKWCEQAKSLGVVTGEEE